MRVGLGGEELASVGNPGLLEQGGSAKSLRLEVPVGAQIPD